MEFLDGFIISKEAKNLYMNQRIKKVTQIIKYRGKEYKYEKEITTPKKPRVYKKATIAYNWLKDNYEKYKDKKKWQIYKEFKKENDISERSYDTAYEFYLEEINKEKTTEEKPTE